MGEGAFEVQRLEVVGPKVGEDLKAGALNAVFYAVLIIAIYISGRFEQRWLAAGAMAGGLAVGIWALRYLGLSTGYLILGAITITWCCAGCSSSSSPWARWWPTSTTSCSPSGFFSIFDLEFDLTVVAALLTILGYSLNDTIIVYDRIRERLHHTKGEPLISVINSAVNQTLSRTMLTSLITLFTVVALFIFGGSVLRDFALAMIIGVITGPIPRSSWPARSWRTWAPAWTRCSRMSPRPRVERRECSPPSHGAGARDEPPGTPGGASRAPDAHDPRGLGGLCGLLRLCRAHTGHSAPPPQGGPAPQERAITTGLTEGFFIS